MPSSGYYWYGRLHRLEPGEEKKRNEPEAHLSYQTSSVTQNGAVSGRHGIKSWLDNEAQTLMSENHPYRKLGKDGNKEIGGDFRSQKIEIAMDSWAPKVMHRKLSSSTFTTETLVLAPTSDFNILNKLRDACKVTNGSVDITDIRNYMDGNHKLPYYPDSFLDNWGTSVINSIAPTNPVADLATTLAELASERKFFARPGGALGRPDKEFLNFQFGMLPTASFAKDLRKAVSNRDKIINQYERDSGKRVRRSFSPPPVVMTESTEVGSTFVPIWSFGGLTPSASVAGTGVVTKVTKDVVRLWFSGAFTYHLPKRGWKSDLERLDKLYGVLPSKSTFWELTPYSWLADYFTTEGDYQQNLDSFAGNALVMPYGYVMCEQRRHIDYKWVGNVRDELGILKPYTSHGTITWTNMHRRKATPYGFGMSSSDLTGQQIAVITALGLSKSVFPSI